MSSINRKAIVPAALLLALPGTVAAAPAAQAEYTMTLRPAAATVASGGTAATLITFQAPRYLRGTRVQLSTTGLPAGVSAAFYPPTPRIGGVAVLTFTTAASSPVGLSAVTVTAITISSDPIGTSTTFGLTINAR